MTAKAAIVPDIVYVGFQNRLYSGKRRYLTQYVNKYPIPDLHSNAAKTLVSYIKRHLMDGSEISESTVDRLVNKCFEV